MNEVRGEVPFEAGGKTYTLCLTLEALAEIESGLGLTDFTQIQETMSQLRFKNMVVVLKALARGGGHSVAEAEQLVRSPFNLRTDLQRMSEAIGKAMRSNINDQPEQATVGEQVAQPLTGGTAG